MSAVSTGSQIMQSVTTVITGIAMGITVLVGQKIGEKRPHEAGTIIGSGIAMFAVIAVILTILMPFGSGALSAIMQAPEEAFAETTAYIRICSAGAAFIIAYNVLGSVFRGIGDSKMPLLTVAIACAINIAGDLLFVAGFHWGAAGAAAATVLAQAISVLLSILIIRKRSLPFIMKRTDIRFDLPIIGKILKLGCPIALQDFLVSISFLVILAAADYLKAYAIDCILTSFLFCFVGFFNGSGRTLFVMTQGIVVRIPVAFLTSRRAGVTLFQIGLATPVSSLIQIILCLGYFSMFHKKMRPRTE